MMIILNKTSKIMTMEHMGGIKITMTMQINKISMDIKIIMEEINTKKIIKIIMETQIKAIIKDIIIKITIITMMDMIITKIRVIMAKTNMVKDKVKLNLTIQQIIHIRQNKGKIVSKIVFIMLDYLIHNMTWF